MSRRPLSPATDLATSNQANNGKLYKVCMARVSPNGTIDNASKSLGRFLLNPESWDESITSGWTPNSIPGQSNPIYQWTMGGPRVISFDVLVTKDTSEFLKDKASNPLAGALDSAINAVGDIASSFIGINLPPLTDLFGVLGTSEGEDLSITNQLNYYRSLLYPSYVAGKVDASPPLVALYAGKTFGSTAADKIGANTDVWVVTELRIKITKQLPNLTPMEAIVSFKLNQYPFTSIGSDHFGQSAPSVSTPGTSLNSIISGLF